MTFKLPANITVLPQSLQNQLKQTAFAGISKQAGTPFLRESPKPDYLANFAGVNFEKLDFDQFIGGMPKQRFRRPYLKKPLGMQEDWESFATPFPEADRYRYTDEDYGQFRKLPLTSPVSPPLEQKLELLELIPPQGSTHIFLPIKDPDSSTPEAKLKLLIQTGFFGGPLQESSPPKTEEFHPSTLVSQFDLQLDTVRNLQLSLAEAGTARETELAQGIIDQLYTLSYKALSSFFSIQNPYFNSFAYFLKQNINIGDLPKFYQEAIAEIKNNLQELKNLNPTLHKTMTHRTVAFLQNVVRKSLQQLVVQDPDLFMLTQTYNTIGNNQTITALISLLDLDIEEIRQMAKQDSQTF